MIPISQCRELLGPECALSDTEVERLRDELYALADIAITIFEQRRGTHPKPAEDHARRDLLPRFQRGTDAQL